MKRLVRRALGILLGAALLWLAILSWSIVRFGARDEATSHDAAIVLGAAAYGSTPSPVYRERIRHALSLYRSGTVRKLIFTGASALARPWPNPRSAATSPCGQVFRLPTSSSRPAPAPPARTFSRPGALCMQPGSGRLRSVSDPLHMKRALRMSADLGIVGVSSPTPTTRYRGWRSKAAFLARELYFYHHYLVFGA